MQQSSNSSEFEHTLFILYYVVRIEIRTGYISLKSPCLFVQFLPNGLIVDCVHQSVTRFVESIYFVINKAEVTSSGRCLRLDSTLPVQLVALPFVRSIAVR